MLNYQRVTPRSFSKVEHSSRRQSSCSRVEPRWKTELMKAPCLQWKLLSFHHQDMRRWDDDDDDDDDDDTACEGGDSLFKAPYRPYRSPK